MLISYWSSDVCSSDLRLTSIPASWLAPTSACNTSTRPSTRISLRFIDRAAKPFSPDSACPSRSPNTGACEDMPRPLSIANPFRSEEHTSELQSLMRISYAVFCLKQTNTQQVKTYEH